jgi:hypothetical protein
MMTTSRNTVIAMRLPIRQLLSGMPDSKFSGSATPDFANDPDPAVCKTSFRPGRITFRLVGYPEVIANL